MLVASGAALALASGAAIAAGSGEGAARAVARAYVEATFRGDRAALLRLTARSEGVTEEAFGRAIDARLVVWNATRRLGRSIAVRFGPAAAVELGLSRRVDEEAGAVEAAPLERDRGVAVLRLAQRPPLVLERRWLSWKVRPGRGAADAWEPRMIASAPRAPSAADEAIRAIETGTCADARCADEIFRRILFGRPGPTG